VTLVDTNVLLDVLTNDAKWLNWSILNLRDRAAKGPLIINDVIYAEMSGHIRTERELDEALQRFKVTLERTPKAALFLAGVTFRQYRQSGGTRTGVLPDLFIGAHAHVSRFEILTRDVGRYRTYFPDVTLIAP
jgi:hypothetical protein